MLPGWQMLCGTANALSELFADPAESDFFAYPVDRRELIDSR
jgi:hypothetical protein